MLNNFDRLLHSPAMLACHIKTLVYSVYAGVISCEIRTIFVGGLINVCN